MVGARAVKLRTLNKYCTESTDWVPATDSQHTLMIESIRSDYLRDLENLRKEYAVKLMKLCCEHGSVQSLLQ